MINKLISKSQVNLLECENNASMDYKMGYCSAIRDVLDLEPIPTLGVDEIEKIQEEMLEYHRTIYLLGKTDAASAVANCLNMIIQHTRAGVEEKHGNCDQHT